MNIQKKIKIIFNWIGLASIAIPTVFTSVSYAANTETKENLYLKKANEQLNINWDSINNLKKQLLNKLASRDYEYLVMYEFAEEDEAIERVQAECSKLNYMLCKYDKDKKPEEKTDVEWLDECYKFIFDEANKLGIDLVDYDLEIQQLENANEQDFNIIKNNHTYPLSVARNIVNKIDDKIEYIKKNILPQAEEFLWDSYQFQLKIIDILNSSDIFDVIKRYTRPNITNNALESDPTANFVLSRIDSAIGTSLTQNVSSNDSAVQLLKYYSSTGKYSSEEGFNEIATDDLKFFFNYTYDPMFGAILSPVDFDVDLVSDAYGEYNGDLIQKVTQPLSTYDGAEATYKQGEMFPGYTTHAKIVDIDYLSNSDKCYVKFQFGVSETAHPEKGVLWSQVQTAYQQGKTLSDDDTDDKKVLSCEFSLATKDYASYCASNYYYKNWEATPTSEFCSDINNQNEYGSKTISDRPKLERILDKYKGPVIDETGKHIGYAKMNDYPIELTKEDYNNLQLDKIISEDKTEQDVSASYHENQQFKLYAFGVDTVSYTLKVQWASCDNTFGIVSRIKWSSDVVTDQNGLIAIKFDIDKTLKNEIIYSSSMFAGLKAINQTHEFISNTDIQQSENLLTLSISYDVAYCGVMFALNIANIALSAFYAGLAVMSAGVLSFSFAFAIACLAATIYATYANIETSVEKISKKVEGLEALDDLYKFKDCRNIDYLCSAFNNINDKLIEFFPKNREIDETGWNPLFDELATFDDKQKVCDMTIAYTNNQAFLDKFADFVEDYKNIIDFTDEEISEIRKPIDFTDMDIDIPDYYSIQPGEKGYTFTRTISAPYLLASHLVIAALSFSPYVKISQAVVNCTRFKSLYTIEEYLDYSLQSFSCFKESQCFFKVNMIIRMFADWAQCPDIRNPNDKNLFSNFTKYFDSDSLERDIEQYFISFSKKIWNGSWIESTEKIQLLLNGLNEVGLNNLTGEFVDYMNNLCISRDITREAFFSEALYREFFVTKLTTGELPFDKFLKLYRAVNKSSLESAMKNLDKYITDHDFELREEFKLSKDVPLSELKKQLFGPYKENIKNFLRSGELDANGAAKAVSFTWNAYVKYTMDSWFAASKADWLAVSFFKVMANASLVFSPGTMVALLLIPNLLEVANKILEYYGLD